jgi:methionyl-tRNA formyltransferase
MPLRLIFMGTPDFAVPTLSKIRDLHEIVAVYTRAPRPAGRGMELVPSPVEREAKHLGLPVLTPTTLKTTEAQAEFAAHQADAAIVVAYGLILPKPVLEAPQFGCFNLHPSILPRWRGAAPINRPVMAGDKKTAAMVMKMEEGLDTGPVVWSKQTPILADMTAGDLHDVLKNLGADRVVRALAQLEKRGVLVERPQSAEGATYAAKIDKAEARIDWTKSFQAVHNHCRGLSPFPGAWCEIHGARLKILRTTKSRKKKISGSPGTVLDDMLTVACGNGAIRIIELQAAGKRAMKAEEFLHGTPVPPGTVLT